MKTAAVLFFLLCLTTILFAGAIVAETERTLTYRQDDGRLVTLTKHPARTVIAYTSFAQIWYCAGGTAVGIPTVKALETLPSAAASLPAIGQVTSPNPEKVLALRPSLVLLVPKYEKHQALRGILNRAGVESVSLTYANYTDFLGLLELFSRLNGTELKKNEQAERIVDEVDALCKKTKHLKPPRFAILFAASRGFSLEKNGVNTAQMAAMLGGQNIVGEAGSDRIKFSFERFLLEDPEIIFIITMGQTEKIQKKVAAELMNQPAWKQLKAVKTGRVHFLPVELYLYLPGTRFPEAFRGLAKLMYPGTEF